MSNQIEAKFDRPDDLSGRELRCQVDGGNRVSWQEVPKGEEGTSMRFATPGQAEDFMRSIARMLGYPRRFVNE